MKKKQMNRPKYAISHDHGTPERIARGEVIVENNHARIKRQHPLHFYENRGDITIEQSYWGGRLVNDYESAHPGRSSAAMLLRVDGISTIDIPINKLTCLDRWNKVYKQMNTISRALTDAVLIEGYFLSEIHHKMGWSKRNSGVDRFCELLDDIKDSYHRLIDYERDRVQKEDA